MKTRLWIIARPLTGFAETFSQYVSNGLQNWPLIGVGPLGRAGSDAFFDRSMCLCERFLSHRLPADLDAVMDACCHAWNALASETERIRSLNA